MSTDSLAYSLSNVGSQLYVFIYSADTNTRAFFMVLL